MKHLAGLLFCLLLVSVTNADNLDSSAALFLKNCAACHGLNLQGGDAQSLVDGKWVFAPNRDARKLVIKNGIPASGMPPHNTFTTQQINGLVDYIDAKAKAFKDNPTDIQPSAGQTIATLEKSDYTLKVQQWVTDVKIPWAIQFLDPTTALVTERPGGLRIIKNGQLDPQPIKNTPEVWHT
ncbi:MAG TPA: hypothetical protein DCM28_01515, partial [Phycisphaerales bacterium]|nr:hypothetical protein [Phycisphaerales bacterium]